MGQEKNTSVLRRINYKVIGSLYNEIQHSSESEQISAAYDQVDEYPNVYTQKYLFSDYYDPGIILGSWDTSINKAKISIFIELSKLLY